MTAGDATSTDVLVVGAGPTGLLLAIELIRRGIRIRLLDREPQRSPHSRALVVQARSLEILEQLGLVDAFLAAGNRNVRARVHADGKPVIDLSLTRLAGEGGPYPFFLAISQVETERILEAQLRALGVEVERPVELVALAQDADGVEATVRRAGSEERISARYVAGCDGAHSAVRHLLGVPFEGAPYLQDFMLGDVAIAWDCPHDQTQIFLARDGVVAAFPLKSERMWRIVASRGRSTDERAPTLDELQTALSHASPYPATIANPEWLARFRLHHRIARSYRVGRAFLAGDAAHIHSPAGGQGMNTGLQDAWNLGWKLALAVQGRAGARLLDSYEAERRPVGMHLLRTTDRLFQFATNPSRFAAFARTRLMPRVAPLVLGSEHLRRSALRTVTQLGIRYRRSPVVSEPPDAHRFLTDGPRAGDRAPDGALRTASGEATRLFLQLRGEGHHLVFFAGGTLTETLARQADALQAPVPITVVASGGAAPTRRPVFLDPDGALHARYGAYVPCHYLVRPDGHVTWRAPGWDTEGALRHLEATARAHESP